MISVFENIEDCCGCTSCENICPTNAIEMITDKEGFMYPKIDQALCINCGKCKDVCAFQKGCDTSNNLDQIMAYGIKHKNDNVRLNSRSGGTFTAISDYVINQSGAVYGAKFDQNLNVVHSRATNKKDRDLFRGSKYVQSSLDNTFKKVIEDLVNEKYVLFSGTPCQTAGLNKYLSKIGINRDKLILVDLVCHGTPSPKIFRDYINFLNKKHKTNITNFEFRNKRKFGWEAHRETYKVRNKEYSSDVYTTLFSRDEMLRPSCYNCKYTNLKRPSDITLGDFWGIEKVLPNFTDDKGISLVFINTAKGKRLFNSIKTELDYVECSGADFIQPNLKTPTECPSTRAKFWNNYEENGFEYIARKYAKYGLYGYSRKIFINLLRKAGMLKSIRKILGK